MQFNSVWSLDRLDHGGRDGGGMRDHSAEILFESFLQEAPGARFGVGRDVHSLMLSIQHFLCRSRRRPPSSVPWRTGFVVTCDMPEPYQFSSLDRCQKRFLWTHTEVVLDTHLVVGLVLQNAEKFPHALGFESLDPFFFRVSKQGTCFTVVAECVN